MPKAKSRGRESLTGGSGDVNPQWMNFENTATTPGVTQTWAYNVPVNRLPTANGRSAVIEVLKAQFEYGDFPPMVAGEATHYCCQVLSTRDHGVAAANSTASDVFAYDAQEIQGAFTAAGSYSSGTNSHVVEHDYTDGAGHGVLIATDVIYAQLQGTAPFAEYLFVKLLYRVKNVTLLEYLGIVQSQQ